ncbi:hypothetical protein [Streptomyces sp. REN17]|uniref:hypothetical protein n=1 Tax=Streptomyces beigongshangae TaxID=2841597 RepID=UPI001C841E16
MRRIGGAPIYALTDNERTVTTDHIARIPVRNSQIIKIGHHRAHHQNLLPAVLAAPGPANWSIPSPGRRRQGVPVTSETA